MDIKFFEYLVAHSSIDGSLLRLFVADHRNSDGDVYRLLVSEGLIGEIELARYAGKYYNNLVVDIHRVEVQEFCLSYGNRAFCLEEGVLVFGHEAGGGLLIAIADCSRKEMVSEKLQQTFHAQKPHRFFIAPVKSLLDKINRCYDEIGGSVVRGEINTLYSSSVSDEMDRPSTSRKEKESLNAETLLSRVEFLESENASLRIEMERLRRSFSLETVFTRELFSELVERGFLSEDSYERLLRD